MEEFYFYTKGLTVGYHGVPLIKDIELCLKKGEIMTLIGPNGAGKTTILKSIIRQLKPLGGVAWDFSKTSDGQKQRVMLARALCQQPDIIVLDEPTSFLDIRYKLEFLSIIQNMSRTRHLSVIMSLHELDLAGRISDKIACVHGDRVDRFGTPEEIFTAGYIPKLYGMTVGSYEERTGDLELPKVEGDPKVFVLAGNGTGTAVFRKLQRDGIPFAAGILWENDLDYPAAKALASEVVSVKAFCEMDEASLNRAKALVDQCEEVLCTVDLTEAGAQAESLRILYEYAKMKINIKKVLQTT